MIVLAQPWLLGLLPLPLLLRYIMPAWREARRALAIPDIERVARASGQEPGRGVEQAGQPALQLIAIWAAWISIVLALAQPQRIGEAIEKTIPTRDLLVAIDLSGSMETNDFIDAAGGTTDRATALKQVLDAFLERREGDRVGLIVFGDAPFVQVPFTDDLGLCRRLLAEIEPRMAGPRTMLGDAIGLAINVFEKSEVEERTLLLLTDGNDTGSRVPPVEAAEIARDRGITIHTVGIGDPQAAGEERLDDFTLRSVAETAGGSFFLAQDRDALERICQTIDGLETRKVEVQTHRPRHELFHWSLALLIIVSLLWHGCVAARAAIRGASLRPTLAPLVVPAALFAVAAAGSFQFLRPLWLLAGIPATVIGTYVLRRQDHERLLRRIVQEPLLSNLLLAQGGGSRVRPAILMIAVWAVSIIAAAGPAWRRAPLPFAGDAAALIVALEVTPTMTTKDIKPTRLERSVLELRDLLERRPGARTALVAWAGSAHLAMPLTADAGIIERFGAGLSPEVMPVKGEALANAISLGRDLLQESEEGGSILLVTDGVAPEIVRELRDAAAGTTVHILAVGAPGGLDRPGLEALSDALDATLTFIAPDESDVDRLTRLIETRFTDVSTVDESSQFQDEGWRLLPLIAFLITFWFRRNWVVRHG